MDRFERSHMENSEIENTKRSNLIKHEVIEIADMVEQIQSIVKI